MTTFPPGHDKPSPAVRLTEELLDELGFYEDTRSDNFRETPHRFAKAWDEWTVGYTQDPARVLKCFEHPEEHDTLVFQANIPTYSLCCHHLAPFFGVAHIAYLPNGKVVGLSKLTRLVDVFARRLQIQERLCAQVADSMMANLECKGVGVVMQMRHMCMESRGVNKPGTITMTSALRGVFKTDATVRAEFMGLVQTATQGVRSV